MTLPKQGQGAGKMKPNIKKLLILNAPYLLFVWLFMKIGEAFRLSPGADLSGKLLHIMEGVTAAFEKPMPSLNGQDFLIGVAGAVILQIAVYMKGKNAKKYRKGVEYGSARWGKTASYTHYHQCRLRRNHTPFFIFLFLYYLFQFVGYSAKLLF